MKHKHTSPSVQLPLLDPITIKLTKGFAVIVDAEDSDLANTHWCAKDGAYPYALHRITTSPKQSQNEYMHRLILERKVGRKLLPSEQADHINGNIHDNRRSNLRLATQQQNRRNTKRLITNQSGYKGVTRHGRGWRATILINRKQLYLGTFDTAEEAHAAYVEAAVKHFGEFARFD